MNEPTRMKRFALYGGFLVPSDEGRYVMYSEAQARIAELERTNLLTYHDVLCQRDAYRERMEKLLKLIDDAPHDYYCIYRTACNANRKGATVKPLK